MAIPEGVVSGSSPRRVGRFFWASREPDQGLSGGAIPDADHRFDSVRFGSEHLAPPPNEGIYRTTVYVVGVAPDLGALWSPGPGATPCGEEGLERALTEAERLVGRTG